MAEQVSVGGKINEEGYTRHWYQSFLEGVGTRSLTSWKVIQRAAGANMSVDVQQGDGFIDTSSSHGYFGWVASSDKNTSVDAADVSNPRIDRVVAYVDLASISDATTNNTGALKFKAVAGTPAGSPAAPNDAAVQASVGASNPFYDIAQVAVAAGATSITTANITDKRTAFALRAPLAPTITEVTASTDMTHSYDVVKANANGGSIASLTLPDATLQSGREMRVYKSDSSANTVTIDCTGSQTINGEASYILAEQNSVVVLFSDGSNWIIRHAARSPFRFRVCKSDTTQSISATTWTKVSFQTEQYDYNGDFDNATNYRYTAPVAGTYEFESYVVGEASIGANHLDQLKLYKNGSEITHGSSIGHVTSTNNHGSVKDRLKLAAGDYIEVWFFTSAAGQLDGAASTSQTYFTGQLLDYT